MIATITLADKNERAKDKNVQRTLLGYDPDVWMETDVQIRDSDQGSQEYKNTTYHHQSAESTSSAMAVSFTLTSITSLRCANGARPDMKTVGRE